MCAIADKDAIAAQETLVAALANPVCYPHPVERVRVIETHISHVLLTGRYAYKIKKPVDLGLLDFSTLERRRCCCEEELRLNRQLAPRYRRPEYTAQHTRADAYLRGRCAGSAWQVMRDPSQT